MTVPEAKRPKELEAENARLKKLLIRTRYRAYGAPAPRLPLHDQRAGSPVMEGH